MTRTNLVLEEARSRGKLASHTHDCVCARESHSESLTRESKLRDVDTLEFSIDGANYVVPLIRVLEILPRVWLTPLPEAPAHVRGAFSYRGEIALAVDIRRRLGHQPARPHLSEHFVMTRGKFGPIAVVADRAVGVLSISSADVQAVPLANRVLSGIVALPDGLLFVDDLDALLSDSEEAMMRKKSEEALG